MRPILMNFYCNLCEWSSNEKSCPTHWKEAFSERFPSRYNGSMYRFESKEERERGGIIKFIEDLISKEA